MQITDATKILIQIQTTYPNWKPQTDFQLVIQIWAEYLEPYSYEECRAALHAYATSNTSGFAPSPGQLIELIDRMKRPQELNGQEAWHLVMNAVRNSGYHAQEEFDALPETVRETFGGPERLHHMATDENFNEPVEQSNFLRDYRITVARKSETARMPSQVAELINRYVARLEDVNRPVIKREMIPQKERTAMSAENEERLKELREKLNEEEKRGLQIPGLL
jgi:hypothetical protein